MDSGWRVNPGCGRRDSLPADPNFPPLLLRCPRNRGKWGQRGQRCGGEMRSWRRRSATTTWLGRREQAAARRERTTSWVGPILQKHPSILIYYNEVHHSDPSPLICNLTATRGGRKLESRRTTWRVYLRANPHRIRYLDICVHFFINKANIMALC